MMCCGTKYRFLSRYNGALCAVLVIVSTLPPLLEAQPKLQLKRTRRESTPFTMRLLGGYNGVSEPSDALQDLIECTPTTIWGGVMAGAQGIIPLDTLGFPLSLGFEAYYHRMAKRWLGLRPEVKYVSDGSDVRTDEYIHGIGVDLLVQAALSRFFTIHLGGGPLCLFATADIDSEVSGLFPTTWMPCVFGAVNYALLRYEHGSIDGTIRLTKGFGRYGSFHFQSLLAFTFNF
ncbi:MAG: hypothetical protein QHI48_11535 [Bacteroidota bacterium]|nr:hypothetical protein [Bacteroidota bacterium]